MIDLKVTTLSRKVIDVKLRAEDTISMLMEELRRKTGCPLDLQVLVFPDGSKVGEVRVANGRLAMKECGLSQDWACLIRELPARPCEDCCGICGCCKEHPKLGCKTQDKRSIRKPAKHRGTRAFPLPPMPSEKPPPLTCQPSAASRAEPRPLQVNGAQSAPVAGFGHSTPALPGQVARTAYPPAIAAPAASVAGVRAGVTAPTVRPPQSQSPPRSAEMEAAEIGRPTSGGLPLGGTAVAKGAASAQTPGGRRIRRADLERVGRLGVGAFGVVTLEQDRRTGRTYALKAVSKGYLAELKMQYSVLNEKKILKLVDSPFIVRLLATYNGREYVYFLLEAALGGELFTTYERLRIYGCETHARFYVACVTEALQHLHERNVIYRDLKPENLLLDARGYCKLTDMGLAKVSEGLTWTLVGTPDYMAPEMIRRTGHGCTVDWWMLGVLLFELLAGRAPFEAPKTEQTYELVKRGINQVNFPPACRGSSADLVRRLCRDKPEERLGESQIIEHPWFVSSDFDWAQLRCLRMQPPFRPTVKGQRDNGNFRECDQEDPPAVHYEPDPNNPHWDDGFEEDIMSLKISTL